MYTDFCAHIKLLAYARFTSSRVTKYWTSDQHGYYIKNCHST